MSIAMTAGRVEIPQGSKENGTLKTELTERTVMADGWIIVNTTPQKSLCCGGATCSAVKIAVIARRPGMKKRILGVSDPKEEHQKRALAAADHMPMYQGWTITLEPAAQHLQPVPGNA